MTNYFQPSFFLKNKHLQTLYSSLFRKIPTHNFFIERFELSDKDFLECYWYKEPTTRDSKPIVILFHGLAGSYKSPYIQGTMEALDKAGFNSVVMHFRGCSRVINIKASSYHSGKTDDTLEYVSSLRLRYRNSKLFGVGYSIGGNMLLKLLGEEGETSPFSSVIAVSAPMQLDICANSMDRGFSKLYQHHLIKKLNTLLKQKCEMHDMKKIINFDKKDIKNLRTFWEYDDAYTAPVHGFKNVKDYYRKSSSKQFLKNIKTKTLIIHSKDDPFMTPKVIPKDDEISQYITLEIYAKGGHVGFIEGSIFRPKYWLEKRFVEFFKQSK